MTDGAGRPFAVVDRDGTLIEDRVYLADPDGIAFLPGAIEGLRALREAGFGIVMATNQSGIARGYFDEAALARIHARLTALLAAEGLSLDAIYHCPHGPDDGCDCRKPLPGMVAQAMADFGFRADEAVFIGDTAADMGAAAASGLTGIQVYLPAGAAPAPGATHVAPDFAHAARVAIDLHIHKSGVAQPCT
ncbi:D-glycero-alpha-D-manno-heptose-1,7-bisphosphate 7-phosphatase [Sphingomonas oryzagri]|uniref:D,D-heptose 1,7-bisphosphate phosphatase n=1 Tax=Sphingomonas oryzagri TaxID=3042314 RepID=A0ABT6MW71_9SPHN|nr:HAD family hydrolase [Sphingomonas oryzagri]MDH7637270.1 HAD family hydrolase [Sphingomonas oryzagri]